MIRSQQFGNKGGFLKEPPPPISCFPHILARLHQIFKMIVPIPYNISLIMEGRDKNFEDLMQSDKDIRKTRYGRRRFFTVHPLTSILPPVLAQGIQHGPSNKLIL